jgi:protoporphyrin/coproporphyrin ferrochelatase
VTEPVGVLLMAYGTPRRPEDIEAYYTDIRRGRPPTPEQLQDLTDRYAAIGGVSPLAQRTEAQAAALQDALDERLPGGAVVRLGLKHAAPFIEDTVDELVAGGARRIVGLVLAPHYSAMSVGQYLGRARERAASHDAVEVLGIESWHLEPAYLDFLARSLQERLAGMPAATKVLFTAHSLPQRILDTGDPYPEQLRATAAAVAERAGLNRWAGWSVAWQSAGRTPEPWLGPDVLEVVRDLAATGRAEGVVVCPCGFTSDHLEVLYDLDIEAAGVAREVGLAFARTASLNDDPAVMGALADRVVQALATTSQG